MVRTEPDDLALSADSADGRSLQQLVMRLAVSRQGMPKSCTRQACRRTELCHMDFALDGSPRCGADYLPDLVRHDCEVVLDFVAQYARVLRAGEPWSRYDGDRLAGLRRRRSTPDLG